MFLTRNFGGLLAAHRNWLCLIAPILLKVVQSFREPTHDLFFAFEWAKLSRFEQFDLVWPLQNGTYAQWEQVIRLHALATVQMPEAEGLQFYREVRMNGKSSSGFWTRRNPTSQRIESDSFTRFLEWTRRYFGPMRSEELCERYPCTEYRCRFDVVAFEVRLSQAPTQHERLEALLQLRDWLRDKAAPDEIERLLSEE